MQESIEFVLVNSLRHFILQNKYERNSLGDDSIINERRNTLTHSGHVDISTNMDAGEMSHPNLAKTYLCIDVSSWF